MSEINRDKLYREVMHHWHELGNALREGRMDDAADHRRAYREAITQYARLYQQKRTQA